MICGTVSGPSSARLRKNPYAPPPQVVQKLISKERRGSKVIKKYDQAKTPYQRVLASDSIPEVVKTELREFYRGLDPIALFRQLEFYEEPSYQNPVARSQTGNYGEAL